MTRTKTADLKAPAPVKITMSRRAAQAARRAEHTVRLLARTPQRMAALTGKGVRMFGLFYADTSPDFLRLMASRHIHDQVLVEYSPANLGTIKVQKPWDSEWLVLASAAPEYANGLTMHTHARISNRLKTERFTVVEFDGELLEQAKAELRDFLAMLQIDYAVRASSA